MTQAIELFMENSNVLILRCERFARASKDALVVVQNIPSQARKPESIADGAFLPEVHTEPFAMDPDLHRGDGDGERGSEA
jgi:hypothetical protein